MRNTLFALTLLFTTQLNCQTVIETIDFLQFRSNTSSFVKTCKTNYNQVYAVRITNINRAVFKIEDSTVQEDFNITAPSIFEGIKLPAYLNFSIPQETENYLGGGNSNAQIENYFSHIQNANRAMGRIRELEAQLKDLASNCSLPYSDIRRQADALITSVRTETALQGLCPGFSNNTLESFIRSHIACAEASLDSLNVVGKQFIDDSYQEFAKTKLNLNEATAKLAIENKKEESARNKKLISDLESSIRELNQTIESKLYERQIASFEKQLAESTTAVAEMKKIREEGKILQLLNLNASINESNFTYYSDWFRAEKDLSTVEIKIKPSGTCDARNQYRIQRKYPTNGGIKIDFSSGVFFNAGGPDFLGNTYVYEVDTDPNNVRIIQQDAGSRMLLSAGALMHVYKRTCKNFHWAGSLGVSLSTDQNWYNLHAGVSGISGRKNRFVFTLGITMRQANILDSRYKTDIPYPKASLPEVPPTISAFPKFGGFLAVTYNWENLNK